MQADQSGNRWVVDARVCASRLLDEASSVGGGAKVVSAAALRVCVGDVYEQRKNTSCLLECMYM